jgi:hypothetical protein
MQILRSCNPELGINDSGPITKAVRRFEPPHEALISPLESPESEAEPALSAELRSEDRTLFRLSS